MAARLWWDTWIALALTLPVFAVEMGGHLVPPFHRWVHMTFGSQMLGLAELVLTAAVLAGPGFRFFQNGLPALVQLAPDMNSLVALGAGAAFLYSALVVLVPWVIPEASRSLYFEAASVIVTLILLGRALEARAKGQAGAAIARLVALAPKTARVVGADGAVSEVPIASLGAGMAVQIRPGQQIPVFVVMNALRLRRFRASRVRGRWA